MLRLMSIGLVALAVLVGPVRAADSQKAAGPDPQKYNAVVQKAINFLNTAQADDGSFSKQGGVGITALVATALLQNGRSANDPVVAKALKFLQGYVQKDGGIYTPDTYYKNYETCLAILCFTAANRDGKYKNLIATAEKYVTGMQFDEGEQKDKSDLFYGGAGYGKSKRPDLSNTSFLVDALKACGRGPDDAAMQKALVFVSRCQNLETEANTTTFPAKNPDGGFYYTPAAGGSSPAGTTPNGGLRSYASMTYAGLKSMLYAGVGPKDPRVKAAVAWASKHYGLDENPGMGKAGLFYYYHVFAKALSAFGGDFVTDDKGVKHDWRKDLVDALAERQQPNGSFVNTADRWMEGDPNLVTGFALMSLSYCPPQAAGK